MYREVEDSDTCQPFTAARPVRAVRNHLESES